MAQPATAKRQREATLRRHLPALLGAATAGLRTTLAVLGLVLAAFGRAAVARLGARPADGGGQGRAAAHVTGANPAQLGAVAACPDAFGHLGVADAGVAAVLARLGARDARLDAASELLVGHECLRGRG